MSPLMVAGDDSVLGDVALVEEEEEAEAEEEEEEEAEAEAEAEAEEEAEAEAARRKLRCVGAPNVQSFVPQKNAQSAKQPRIAPENARRRIGRGIRFNVRSGTKNTKGTWSDKRVLTSMQQRPPRARQTSQLPLGYRAMSSKQTAITPKVISSTLQLWRSLKWGQAREAEIPQQKPPPHVSYA
jgi:pyruvate/2-oxoglutarate dehydrogenase complex dihydrolipoamide acyltransferase (E2) component